MTTPDTRAKELAGLLRSMAGIAELREMNLARSSAQTVSVMHEAASLIESLCRREQALAEQTDKCAALLEVIAENAMKRDDTVEWSMASVMAKDARALAGEDVQG